MAFHSTHLVEAHINAALAEDEEEVIMDEAQRQARGVFKGENEWRSQLLVESERGYMKRFWSPAAVQLATNLGQCTKDFDGITTVCLDWACNHLHCRSNRHQSEWSSSGHQIQPRVKSCWHLFFIFCCCETSWTFSRLCTLLLLLFLRCIIASI